jgi:hypothetical protein
VSALEEHASNDLAVRSAGSDVISQVFGDEAVVVQLATGAYYALDAERTLLFETMRTGSTVATLIEGRDPADVRSLVAYLAGEQLIAVDGDVAVLGMSVAEVPGVAKFTDLADLIVLDPIHDIDLDGDGWPVGPTSGDVDDTPR